MSEDASKVARENNPLYFAFENRGGENVPIGIFKFWDFNRGPCFLTERRKTRTNYPEESILSRNVSSGFLQ